MDSAAMHYASQAMYLVLMLSLPAIMVAAVVGLGLSLFQAITQLQEQTLAFGVKLIAVSLTIFAISGWASAQLLRFAAEIFDRFWLI